MKFILRILLLIASFILIIVGILVAFFGSGSIAFPVILILLSVFVILVAGFLGNKRIVIRVGSVFLALLFALVGGILTKVAFVYEGESVADYDKRIEIWDGEIPYNNSTSKLDCMHVNKNARVLGATLKFATAISLDHYQNLKYDIDTFTYVHGIKGGYEKETFEDSPYLIPYRVSNSDEAVIIIPGGGFGYKSIDGSTLEGKSIAEALNENGINAFVLWYRSNPYKWPVPQLDLQRAVKFLKKNAIKYGIHKDKISLLGFSAGGYLVGSFLNQFCNTTNYPENYKLDDVDLMDDTVKSAGMIYSAFSFYRNIPMLFCLFDEESVNDSTERSKLLSLTDLTKSNPFKSKNTKQFICYGTKDRMVGMDYAKAYIKTARKAGTMIYEQIAEEQDHGFDTSFYLKEYCSFLKG